MATNYKDILKELHESLNILREREAKHGGNAPIDLLNQIADYKTAITLTEEALNGDLSKSNWQQAIRPLMVTIRERGQSNVDCRVTIGQITKNVQQVKIGDIDGGIEESTIAGRDIIYNINYHIESGEQISAPPRRNLPQKPAAAAKPKAAAAPPTKSRPRRRGWLLVIAATVIILVVLVGIGVAGYMFWPVEPQKMANDGRFTVAIPGFTAPNGVAASNTGTTLAQAVATELQKRFADKAIEAQVWGPAELKAAGHPPALDPHDGAGLETLAANTGAKLIVYGSIDAEQQFAPQFETSVVDFKEINEYNELISDHALGTPLALPDNLNDEGQMQAFVNPLAARIVAMAYIRQGLLDSNPQTPNYRAALTSFEQAAAIEPWPAEQGKYALYTLIANAAARVADDYRVNKDEAQARAYYEQANETYQKAETILIAHNLQFPSVYLGLGDSHYHLAYMLADSQHLEAAIDYYQKAIKATEQTSRQTPYLAAYARYGLAECYILGNIKLDEALNLFTQVIQDYGDGAHPDLKVRAGESNAKRGAIYYSRGDNDCALREYQLALERVGVNNINRASYERSIKALKDKQADATKCGQ